VKASMAIAVKMSILVDTNVLLRRTQPDHASHGAAVESVAQLLDAGEPGELEKIERLLAVLPDSPAVYGEWRRLVVKHGVLGSKVHDAKLVATMHVHGVRRILTFNVDDFARYQIEAIHPSSLVP
jgi:predicted nucleic acid-binding protein